MALKLFRRHRKECEGAHAEDSRSGEFEEGRRGWKRCACVIHATGTLGGKFSRKQTGKWNWDDAKAVAAEWERAGTWSNGEPAPQPDPPSHAPSPRITIKEATGVFLSDCENRGLADPTVRKYRTFIKQLRTYADSRGYVYLDQLTITDSERFYAGWRDGIRARAKKLDRLRFFVKFCLAREWISKNLCAHLKPPHGSSLPANKTPLTDDELTRIYDACDKLGPPNTRRGPGFRPWGGEDVKTFILLSVFTGLRISDVCLFDISKRLNGNSVHLRMHKTGKPLFTWIPDFLVARLRERERVKGAYIFRSGQSAHLRTITEEWRRKLNKVFKLAGPFEERITPHKFRHTFVRILLEKGVPVSDVAELVGDTPAVLTAHYSKWMEGRQDRLTRILQDAFADKPKPKPQVVSIR